MRLGGVFILLTLALIALSAMGQISLDGALSAWESLGAKLAH